MSKLHSFLASWLALAIVWTGATGLRLPSLPVGPGEILLAGWLMFFAFLLLRGMKVDLGTSFRILLWYWLLAFGLLGLGAVVASSTGRFDAELASHDTLAFLLLAMFVCFAAMLADDQEFFIAVARRTLFLFTFFATAILIIGLIAPRGLGFEIWYGGVRYSGWADNPNQMGLFSLGMPFLGWYLLRRTHGWGRRLPYVVAIGACIWVGVETKSDALRVAWLGSTTLIGALAWSRSLIAQRGRHLYVAFVIVPLAGVALTIALGQIFVDDLDKAVADMYAEGHQGDTRVNAWTRGLQAIAQSPIVGFGPGKFSGRTAPFQGREAHNSLIDWGMSTGILGIMLHLSLFAWCVLCAFRSGKYTLLGILIALTGNNMFGYSLRQPIYWLLLLLVLMLSRERVPMRLSTAAAHAPGPVNARPVRLSAQH